MPKNDPPLKLPVRGAPGGWHDPWGDPDDTAAIRARIEAADRRLTEAAAQTAATMRKEAATARARRSPTTGKAV